MRTAYFDCFSGASGDMVVGALLDAGAKFSSVERAIVSLRLRGVKVRARRVRFRGFRATRFEVAAPAREEHRSLSAIRRIVSKAPLPPRAKERALAVFERLAEAEARVHGVGVEEVHFHEVGASDAIADVVGAAIALEDLGVEEASASTLPLGSGRVAAAHGSLPVPAPGTAELLRGASVRFGGRPGERTTPTGAALLSTLCRSIGDEVALRPEKVGYGAGSRDFGDGPNLLRVVVGESQGPGDGAVDVLETNLDDVPGEVVGHALERLLAAGALDAFATPVTMKKNRPGWVLTALASPAGRPDVEAVFFRETGTLGVRRHRALRTTLARREIVLGTRYGRARFKAVEGFDGGVEVRVEYEEARSLSVRDGIPLLEARRRLEEEGRRLYRPGASSAAEKRRSPSRTRSGSSPKPIRT